jgi:hypothetical protein
MRVIGKKDGVLVIEVVGGGRVKAEPYCHPFILIVLMLWFSESPRIHGSKAIGNTIGITQVSNG